MRLLGCVPGLGRDTGRGRPAAWPVRPPGLCGATLAAALGAAGCSRSPAQSILGSFFPSWMLCAAIGVAAAVASRVLLSLVGLRDDVLLPFVTYPAVALAVAFSVWLTWFGH